MISPINLEGKSDRRQSSKYTNLGLQNHSNFEPMRLVLDQQTPDSIKREFEGYIPPSRFSQMGGMTSSTNDGQFSEIEKIR